VVKHGSFDLDAHTSMIRSTSS